MSISSSSEQIVSPHLQAKHVLNRPKSCFPMWLYMRLSKVAWEIWEFDFGV